MDNDEIIKQGRPREYDRDFIACELVLWAKKETSINLCEFCADKMLPPSKISIWAKECPNFRKAYELAKCFLGYRREQMLTKETLHVKAYDLNATTYDYFLKEEKRLQAEYEASLRKENEKPPEKVVFEVNYNAGAKNPIEILSKTIPATDSSSS